MNKNPPRQSTGKSQASAVDPDDARLARPTHAQFAVIGQTHRFEQLGLSRIDIHRRHSAALAAGQLRKGHRRAGSSRDGIVISGGHGYGYLPGLGIETASQLRQQSSISDQLVQ